ncbi:dicarboxylate/amino acid:cation symporter [Corynebacterium sp. MSK032]|uniref:dicarboxylate/amino acid:cation symporter n=1 Tax=Corynebacterium TaxID=1716 RepID=UPI0008A8E372|nr:MULTISPECIES: dicarboxylate/amino acid:cation symporter [Corynebacterium]MCT1547318.1 dicarboxylate/amino acid:cation symporter [Corynebacterium amycolatum]MDK8727615.1 dicarboxylate/amino acid:cation symporter [Corynebacterium amycolatum]MDK8793344.1 dicarboxylate/amino acid:cation symporter [Corynebacterium sp. MSK032]OHR37899.1 sodium:proton antiporter [Corynebacterium sp. HMSC075F02]TXS75312.1 dicarboxylate/amino acid:cation symporter [Corynebacterium sp. LK11]
MNKFKWATGFGAQVVYGLIIGLILGFMARSTGDDSSLRTALDEVGSTYVTLLKLLIPPLVVTAVVVSIANLRQVAGAAKLAVSTLIWFAITSFVSVVIAIVLGLVIKPGVNSGVDASAAQEPSSVGSWWGFLQSIVPQNFLGLGVKISESDGAVSGSLNFNVLQLLVIAIVFGVAAVKVGPKAEPFIEFSGSLLTIVQKVLWWVIRLAPIGTAALIGHAVAEYGWEALGSLGKFAIAIYVGLFLVIAVVYPVVLKIHGISPIDFFRRVWPVTSLGFFTRSSMGVMPVTERVVSRRLAVPDEYASFAVPLGATTKMDGCAAIYPAIAAIFVSQFYGVPLDFTDYLLIIFVSVIGSAATAGTTGATVMLTLTLSTLGLPLAGVGLLLAVEPIVDMGRTAVNVTGQAVVPLVVAKRAGIWDKDEWDASANADLSPADESDDESADAPAEKSDSAEKSESATLA